MSHFVTIHTQIRDIDVLRDACGELISPAGEIHIEAEGYSGNSCEEATRFLEEALGVPAKRSRKAEFYQRKAQASNQQKLES